MLFENNVFVKGQWRHKFTVQEFSGASHSKNSKHYAGISVDINWLNGKHVSAKHPDAKQFIEDARKLNLISNNEWKMKSGAHFHLDFIKPKI